MLRQLLSNLIKPNASSTPRAAIEPLEERRLCSRTPGLPDDVYNYDPTNYDWGYNPYAPSCACYP